MLQNRVGEPKLFKRFGHFSLALLLGFSLLHAESFEDFKRSQAEAYQKYKDERDNAFNNYLKEQWKAYNAFKGTPLYEEPKPKKIESAKAVEPKSVGPKINVVVKKIEYKEPEVLSNVVAPPAKEITQPTIMPQEPKPVAKPQETPAIVQIEPKPKEQITKIEPPKVVKYDIEFDFFGTKIGFDIDKKLQNARFYPQTQEGIANFFDVAASSGYEALVNDIKSVSSELGLNDWGVYLLVHEIANHAYSNADDAKLFSWFVFNKLGYAVRIGLAEKHVVLLHYSKKIIYSTPNYNFGDKKYYVISNYAKGSVGKLYSYNHDYPGSTKELDLSLPTLPNFASDMQKKMLSFEQFGNKFSVPVVYNKNLVDFMNTYPQADYDTFFNAPLDPRTYESLAKGLKGYIDGKQASDAMNFVLHFVQKSFDYERDDQQFGREKVMFAQETLFFDKSDCEDRAVLFSYLIKELFGVSILGVKYKDHMATALYVPMQGDVVKAGSKEFVVADPTYINANIGQSMPKYKPKEPESFIIVKK